jgi:hypothetical protein
MPKNRLNISKQENQQDKIRHFRPVVAFMGGTIENQYEQQFIQDLGKELIRNSYFIIATSGYKGNPQKGAPSAAYCLVQGILNSFDQFDLQGRIQTYPKKDQKLKDKLFIAGKVIWASGRNRTSRQLLIISRSNVLCLVSGKKGAKKGVKPLFDFALGIEKPVLPLPFFNGTSKNLWNKNRELIARDFGIPMKIMNRWSSIKLDLLSSKSIKLLQQEIVKYLIKGIRKKCFVMMPFDSKYNKLYNLVIEPSIESSCFDAIRTDRKTYVGDISERVRIEINLCDCAIAVITESNPNVMYELGLAHALNKPVLLLCENQSVMEELTDLPFDIRNHRILWYPSKLVQKDTDNLINSIANILIGLVNR